MNLVEKPAEEFRHIVRISGTDVDGKKKIPYGLSKIRGIGIRIGEIVCSLAGLDANKKVGYLTEEEANKLDDVVSKFQEQKVPPWIFNRRKEYVTGKNLHAIGSDLVISLRDDLNRLKKIRSYRGIRHELGLPVRGQRTRTSFRTGTTIGVSRKKIAEAAKAAEKAEKEKKKEAKEK
ncbi:MAG: 30S ribosomal protein S13 [Euryarchaeota archaeon]|nr:30S ribosomal protein S13 [Euryarchaeota archaeon]